jgi:major vault protein
MAEENRERDLVLAPNEYAFISDQTKGNINVYVGPYKTSLANTDKPVTFNFDSKRFERSSLDDATMTFITAPEGWYSVMKNPPKDNLQPKTGTVSNLAELNVGRKVNIPGPVNFALWPGQMAKVLRGHNLRSNQYLLVRIYDEVEAKKNWKNAVIKGKTGEEITETIEVPDLTMGKLLIIKGENVSFYIPPTGVEVVCEYEDEYTREAVTLERLEYCILLDENGNKRYIQGPAVVFPEPTEEFITKNDIRKFRAIELNEVSGLYIKVIAPYSEAGKSYKEGDELFLTGKDQMIYYPRPEHALVSYNNTEKYHAIAIPAGEGRYYLNRKTGTISLQRGPSMFLPDPREIVLVRRILRDKDVNLWFPGNTEALNYNRSLQKINTESNQLFVQDNEFQQNIAQSSSWDMAELKKDTSNFAPQKLRKKEKVSEEVVSDQFQRSSNFTPPRMLTLDSKFDGVVTINLWTGYAVLVVSKTGTRKVVVGPQSYLLEYDESLEAIELSTGTPKTSDNTLKTVYLRVLHNKVSDVVNAETSDYTQVSISLAYRLNFEGEPEKWFNVENYVKFLTDHLRSFIRNAVKKYSVMDFYANGIEVLRDVILGKSTKEEKRQGRLFEENGMRIYDVEILDIRLSDVSVENLIIASQQDVVKQALRISAEKRRLDYTIENEHITQEIAQLQSATARKKTELQALEVQTELSLSLARLESDIQTREKELQADAQRQALLSEVNTAELARHTESENIYIAIAQKRLAQDLERIQAEINATTEKAKAISPDLIAALQAFSDKALAQKMADSMAPLAILGGRSIAEVFSNLLKGTVLGNVLQNTNFGEDLG